MYYLNKINIILSFIIILVEFKGIIRTNPTPFTFKFCSSEIGRMIFLGGAKTQQTFFGNCQNNGNIGNHKDKHRTEIEVKWNTHQCTRIKH